MNISNVLLRHKIISDVQKAVKTNDDHLFQYEYDADKAKSFAGHTRQVLKREGFTSPRVVVRVTDNRIYVIVRQPTYTEKLEALARKLANNVDSEALYEEYLALVGSK